MFPITPPSTAGLDTLVSRTELEGSPRESLWTPARSPSTPSARPPRDQYFTPVQPPSQGRRQRRAHSYSTIDEQHVPVFDSDVGAFKVVIERPGTTPRAREFPNGIPTLEVPIPSYKLGTPRFSTRGTAFLRNSSQTATDEVRSSVFSQDPSCAASHRPHLILSRRHSDASPQAYYSTMPVTPSCDSQVLRSPALLGPRTPIVPEIFDALTFKPSCDHPSVVRYSTGGGIKAATPARLVAEITSPTFVDYDLLSDFFLTFRSFLGTADLLHLLIARLRWALARQDETGTVVRVRTFVALRHWILNYFLDDYVVDWELRQSFCDLINTFVSDLSQDAVQAKVPMKILGELKKCWRRVCALYWDGAEFNPDLRPDVPISPGGIAGSRNPNLDPTFWETHPTGPPQLEGIIEPDFAGLDSSQAGTRNYFADVSRAGQGDSTVVPEAVAAAQESAVQDEAPSSPTSMVSEDFLSCSFPSRGRAPGTGPPLGAHPVSASSIYDPLPPVATTPKTLTGKRVRPTHPHTRSGSFSDSLRDHRVPQQPVQKVLYKSTELLLTLPYAGSLVRGNLFPPGQAFVEAIAPRTPSVASRANTPFVGRTANQKGPSAMSGPGMKKLLCSVRRALSTRVDSNPNCSPTQGSFPHMPPLGVRGATINRLPGTAVVPQARPRNTAPRGPTRIDLLGAEVAEDFKRAVREDAEAEAEMRENSDWKSTRSSEHDPNLHYSTMRPEVTIDLERPLHHKAAPSEMSNGSKSIVIFDDTPQTFESPFMTGALPVGRSDENFADAFIQPSGGPTPPSTPPEPPRGTPRRSSHLLGEHVRTISLERTPSLVIDSRASGEDERSPSHPPLDRPSLHSPGQSFHRPKKSTSLRRYTSFQSGFTRHRSERSFDALTFNESEDVDRSCNAPSVPLPLRVLRRRPGGDLRAVTNVGDLGSQHPLRRTMSTGSLAAYSDSIRSSYLLGEGHPGSYADVAISDCSQSRGNPQRFSLGALTEASPKPHVSLFSTHSTQPVMRPSFEKEAQMLAQIPDDVDDDGGVESALLKLEGKFDQRPSDTSSDAPDRHRARGSFGPGPFDVSTLTLKDEEDEGRRHRQKHVVETNLSKTPPLVEAYRPEPHLQVEELKPAIYRPSGMQSGPLLSSPRSVDSYSSIPLLERGLIDDRRSRRQSRNWSNQSFLRGPSNDGHQELTPQSSHPNSFDLIEETDSMRRIPRGDSKPAHVSVGHSFLDVGSDDDSDLSSEMSIQVISPAELARYASPSSQPLSPTPTSTVIKEMALPSHPLRHPPSPPITLVQALQLSPRPKDDEHEPQTQSPPTPQFTPTQGLGLFVGGIGASPSMDPLRSHGILEPSRKTSVHLPFTLAFDSQILAQQFTLIEKDALNEIDWKDLIEMRWKDVHGDHRSWVDFLRSSEPRGVEVVVARFNLMVKWAISECVLTHDLHERVQCLIKYIHIAAHCRKYRNFATMTQLTIALTSKVISRLTNTWAYVPAAEKQTLKELEALVSPTSNFHSLRAEMEGSGADQGCIPFVGIYTHDLLVNFERPSQIASTPTTEPLVNFEKCRTDATIIKNLLRLLEASQLYRFVPIEGVTERCLWMAALSDEEIERYGKLIQE